MNSLMQDPMFFYAIAFVVFVTLAVIFGRKPAVGWLDGEIAKIRAELDQAAQLRAEAEAALADSKAKQVRAEAEAKDIVTMAKNRVEELSKKAEADLTASLARQQQAASERIRMAEAEAIADVRTAAIDLAMSLARQSLSEKLAPADAAKLIDQAIAELPALGRAKAKAA